MLYYAEEDDYLVVRQAAFKALGMTVSPKEFPQLLDALAESPDECRESAEASAVAALRRLGPDSGAAALVAGRYGKAFNKRLRVSLVHVLSASEDPAALKALQRAARSWTKDVRKAGVDALCQWPTADALDDLHRIARIGKKDVRDAAFDGVLRQLKRGTGRPVGDTLALYADLFALAKTPEQTKAVLAGAGEVADRGALALIAPYLGQDAFRAEAAAAAEKVRRHFYAASSYDGGDQARRMIDGDPSTRWQSDANQQPGQWIQVDMGEKAKVSGVVLDTGRTATEYPRAWEVYVCDDPANPGKAAASGTGETPITEAHFDAAEGRYVKVVLTGAADCRWSVHEIHILTE